MISADTLKIQSSDEVFASSVPHFAKFVVQNDLMLVDVIQGADANGYQSGRRIEKFSIQKNNFNSIIGSSISGYPLIMDKIIVKSGGNLIINGDVKMLENGYIQVEKGGKLIIDGQDTKISGYSRPSEFINFSNITDADYTEASQMWRGIIVNGDAAYSQTPETNQGVIEVKNGATIENAEVAVYVGEYFVNNYQNSLPSNHGGGIIRIENSNFINNQKDIVMRPYGLTSTVTHKPIPQVSYIEKCTLSFNAAMFNDPNSNIGKQGSIYVNGIYGMNIKGNVFKNEESTYLGVGIESVNSSLNIIPYCSTISPCSNPIPNQFENLYQGIRIVDLPGGIQTSKIEGNTFTNTYRSIFLSGTNNARVLLNNIQVPDMAIAEAGQPDLGAPYGIYLNGGKGFQVEENTLWRPSSNGADVFNGSRGIIVNNTVAVDNQIYKNQFTNLFMGIQSQYENSGKDAIGEEIGLKLFCNSLNTSFYDFMAMGRESAAANNQIYDRI